MSTVRDEEDPSGGCVVALCCLAVFALIIIALPWLLWP